LKVSTSLIKELKDEISNEIKTIEELRSKVDEYEVITRCMEHEYKDNYNCRRQSRYVPYKGTFVPYDGTYGAPDQGQTLDV
jgi:hypothetical protein